MRYVVFFILFFVSGCAALPDPEGFAFQTVKTNTFDIAVWTRIAPPADTLKVFIEGDGLAWVSATQPSLDPTPRNSTVLKWAQKTAGNVAYMARPCQYVMNDKCDIPFWTTARFSPETVDAMDGALKTLIKRYNLKKVELVGYSGGGAMAVLLAQRNQGKVSKLTTVAGVLNHADWTAYFGDSPLDGSINAAYALKEIAEIPQIHYAGGKDDVVPPALSEKWIDKKRLVILPNATHAKGFEAIKF